MKIKPGYYDATGKWVPPARVRGIAGEMVIACLVVNETLRPYGLRAVLSEGTGGKHKPGSRHYVGLAIDLRSRDVPTDKREQLIKELRDDLGGYKDSEFQVIEEPTHIHIEFDPQSPLL